VVGGGNYIEYQNLSDYAQSRSNPGQGMSNMASAMAAGGGSAVSSKRILYGCTTLVNANQTMQQLAELGHEM